MGDHYTDDHNEKDRSDLVEEPKRHHANDADRDKTAYPRESVGTLHDSMNLSLGRPSRASQSTHWRTLDGVCLRVDCCDQWAGRARAGAGNSPAIALRRKPSIRSAIP